MIRFCTQVLFGALVFLLLSAQTSPAAGQQCSLTLEQEAFIDKRLARDSLEEVSNYFSWVLSCHLEKMGKIARDFRSFLFEQETVAKNPSPHFHDIMFAFFEGRLRGSMLEGARAAYYLGLTSLEQDDRPSAIHYFGLAVELDSRKEYREALIRAQREGRF
jgi:hypothetical protein